jgi:hypothetical protein
MLASRYHITTTYKRITLVCGVAGNDQLTLGGLLSYGSYSSLDLGPGATYVIGVRGYTAATFCLSVTDNGAGSPHATPSNTPSPSHTPNYQAR